jgi:phage-related protein
MKSATALQTAHSSKLQMLQVRLHIFTLACLICYDEALALSKTISALNADFSASQPATYSAAAVTYVKLALIVATINFAHDAFATAITADTTAMAAVGATFTTSPLKVVHNISIYITRSLHKCLRTPRQLMRVMPHS